MSETDRMRLIHDHVPNEGRGTECKEWKTADGFIGDCMIPTIEPDECRGSIFQDRVMDTLDSAKEIYAERNAVYKDNFRIVGEVMKALFPDGVELKTAEDFTRWHILELDIVKLTRYVQNFSQGGHEDSLKDRIVYLGILAGIDSEVRENL